MNRVLLMLVLPILFWGAPAFAQCANPVAAEGEIIYNAAYNVHQYCNGTAWVAFGALNPGAGGSGCGVPTGAEGDLLYNSAHHVLQYCDGDDWQAVGGTVVESSGSGLSGPSGCANIGDLCADGTVFAGYNPITHVHLFIPPTDQGTTSRWKTTTGTNDIPTDSNHDGLLNTNQIAARPGYIADSTTFPAFKLCIELTLAGKSWYVPSQVELDYLYNNRDILEGAGNITVFWGASYWSSTEYNINNAWNRNYTDGLIDYNGKTNLYRVRCVAQ